MSAILHAVTIRDGGGFRKRDGSVASSASPGMGLVSEVNRFAALRLQIIKPAAGIQSGHDAGTPPAATDGLGADLLD